MANLKQHQKLIFHCEVLRARLEITEHTLQTVAKEIYDNIGQVLSLVNIQLTLLKNGYIEDEKINIFSSVELIRTCIRDLRSMCRLFETTFHVIQDKELNNLFEQTIKFEFPRAIFYMSDKKNEILVLDNKRRLILFAAFLEILRLISESPANRLTAAVINFRNQRLIITMVYRGNIILKKNVKSSEAFQGLRIFKRAQLLNGNLRSIKASNRIKKIMLSIPLK